ncbi:hypothetical protein BST81_03375 [Leptolyngbya sp. 'hensonii']|nr:hypothetical protein BST81_03375 [Leptolyngbya sp. 'hensonii']
MIHLSWPLGNDRHQAQFYLGSTDNLERRLAEHRSGTGARMLKAANERGIAYCVIRTLITPTLQDARQVERRLKARKNHRELLNRPFWTTGGNT